METYIGFKVIKAEPQMKDGTEGYKVVYEDGYESWSPKETFEEAYHEISEGHMTFGGAIEALKKGMKLARKGWNGTNMFIYYVPEGNYPARMEAIKGHYNDDVVPYGAYLAIKTVKDNVVPWVPSINDCLVEDWYTVE